VPLPGSVIIRHKIEKTNITSAWVNAVGNAMLTVNAAPYNTGSGLSFGIGELLFVGLNGNLTGKKSWEIELTFFFARERSVEVLGAGSVPVPAHHYLEIIYDFKAGASGALKVPVAYKVNKIYKSSNFTF
jgi:hypothetical protein